MSFRPVEEGEHRVTIKHNGFALPWSPLKGWASDDAGQPAQTGKVKLTGVGLVRANCHENNFFIVDGSKARPGVPTASLSSGHEDINVELRPVAKEVYEACYVPKTNGTYHLNVTWGGRLVKGCPLSISTQESNSNSTASKVRTPNQTDDR